MGRRHKRDVYKRQGLIDERTAVLRCEPAKLDELLHPVFDKEAMKKAEVIVKGLPASPGAATGPVVFFAEDAEKLLAETGRKAILVRIETSPEDLKGMLDAAGYPLLRNAVKYKFSTESRFEITI